MNFKDTSIIELLLLFTILAGIGAATKLSLEVQNLRSNAMIVNDGGGGGVVARDTPPYCSDYSIEQCIYGCTETSGGGKCNSPGTVGTNTKPKKRCCQTSQLANSEVCNNSGQNGLPVIYHGQDTYCRSPFYECPADFKEGQIYCDSPTIQHISDPALPASNQPVKCSDLRSCPANYAQIRWPLFQCQSLYCVCKKDFRVEGNCPCGPVEYITNPNSAICPSSLNALITPGYSPDICKAKGGSCDRGELCSLPGHRIIPDGNAYCDSKTPYDLCCTELIIPDSVENIPQIPLADEDFSSQQMGGGLLTPEQVCTLKMGGECKNIEICNNEIIGQGPGICRGGTDVCCAIVNSIPENSASSQNPQELNPNLTPASLSLTDRFIQFFKSLFSR